MEICSVGNCYFLSYHGKLNAQCTSTGASTGTSTRTSTGTSNRYSKYQYRMTVDLCHYCSTYCTSTYSYSYTTSTRTGYMYRWSTRYYLCTRYGVLVFISPCQRIFSTVWPLIYVFIAQRTYQYSYMNRFFDASSLSYVRATGTYS